MTTESLRKVIKITDWNLSEIGIIISYIREDSNPKLLHLLLTYPEFARELNRMACIDSFDDRSLCVTVDECTYNLIDFMTSYETCQWEVLNIAIRHEAEKELDNDMNMLEIDSALKALS